MVATFLVTEVAVHGRNARTSRQGAALRRLAVAGATVLGAAAFAGPAQAAGIGAHAPVNFGADTDTFAHLPPFYEDAEGQQVQLCIDVADPACGAVVPPNPDQPVAFSATTPADNNFFDEAFYQRAQAVIGNVQLTLAQEATFDNEAGDGSQAVFGRARIRDIDGELAPGWYRFTYPGGQVDLESDPAAGPIFFSEDVGCGPAVGPLCGDDAAFELPGAANIGPVFLQKDRGAGGAPPAGYLGDAGVAQKVVGSTFVPPGETQPANYFRIERIDRAGGAVTGLVGQTDQFTLLAPGRLAAGTPAGVLLASEGRLGNQRAGQASAAQSITLRNGGSGKVDLKGLAIAGTDAAQFQLDAAGCSDGATSLNPGQTCTVGVTFTPSGTGPRAAQLVATEVNTATGTRQRSFALLGAGVLPVVSHPSAVAFGDQLVGATIGPRVVSVANTGDDTLHITAADLGGPGAGQYTLGLNSCRSASIAPGGQCTVQVFFRPTALGAQSATLNLATDVGGRTIAISGSGLATAVEVITIAGPAGAQAPAPAAPVGVGVSGSSRPKLALERLGGPLRVKRAKATRTGIRLVMRVQDGTETLQIRIYRRSGATRKLVSQGFRTAGKGPLLRVTQSHAALRRAFAVVGRYEVEVTPGRSTSDLGTTSRFSFRIVK